MSIMDILKKKESLADIGDNSPDKKLIDFIFKTLYSEAVNYDKPYARNREDNRKFYKGDQWRRNQPSDKSKSVTNFLSLIVRDEVAILTDSMPDINVRPVDFKGDPEIAMTIRKLIYHILYLQNFQEKMYKAVKLASIEQICYFRPVWNPLLSQGMGDIEILIEKADSIKMDPSGEGNYFIIEKKVTMAEIARIYPDKFKEVSADKKDVKSIADSSQSKIPPKPVHSTDGSEVVIYEQQSMSVQEQMDKVDFHIVWMRDNSVKALDPETTEEPEPMFPNGRWVTIANRKVILSDEPCQTKTFPIVPIILDLDPESDINGISTIDYCKQQQVDYNEQRALQKDWLRGSVFLSYSYDPKSRLDPKKIKNRSWSRAVPASPNDFRYDPPPTLPNESWRDLQESKANIEYVGGATNFSRGRVPAGISAEALRLIKDSERTLLRPKARLIEGAVKKLGMLLIDYIQMGYTTERMLRVIGFNNQEGEDMTINANQVIDNVTRIKNDVTIGEYDVYVEPDSTLPKSEIERFQRMLDLAKEGFLDRTALLQVSGLPNWQEIEQRMQIKEDEFKQQQQAQAQAANQPPPPKPPSVSISYSDLTPDGRVQAAAQAGIQIVPGSAPPNQGQPMPPNDMPPPNMG